MRMERRGWVIQSGTWVNLQREEPLEKTKSFLIPKQWVWEAWQTVRTKGEAPGIDGQSLKAFETNLKGNLYKVWNRMSSGSYYPKPVRVVEIPKSDGGLRPLGIPTVEDRVAQTVAKQFLEPLLEPHFHADSYGYRPGKSALDAVAQARQRCWRADWAIDLDIKGFFDNLDHDLVMRAVRHHTDCRWLLLYIERWLKAPAIRLDGTRVERDRGTPQGGVISPLLANLFLHYAFDLWMSRAFPNIGFERYADDIVIHARSEKQARLVLDRVRKRLTDCSLEVHLAKTKLVYCKDANRTEDYPIISFDFLGYTFRPRLAKNRVGKFFVNFLPAISQKAAKAIRRVIRDWRIASTRFHLPLDRIAELVNPYVRGWANYYGRFYPSAMASLWRYLERTLVRWVCGKYRRFKRRTRAGYRHLGLLARRRPYLFAHWRFGMHTAAE